MKINGELNLNEIKPKKKVPVTRIATEIRNAKDFRDVLKFYVPKPTYIDDGAIMSAVNNPLCVGYILDDGANIRVISVSHKESYGFAQQVKTESNLFQEKELSASDIKGVINDLYNGYAGASGQEEKVLRAIGWATYILKRDFKDKYEKADTEVGYNLEVEDETEKADLIEEMIKDVDMKRFMALLSIGGSSDSRSKFANKDIAMTILTNWANAKVGFYKLFGKKLWIEKLVDVEITPEEMNPLMNEIKNKFPPMSFAVAQTRTEDWMRNVLDNSWSSYDTWRMIPGLTRGMKLSKAFASIYNNPAFDIAVSEVLQNRSIKGILRVSIDPYDYLTSSVNNHNWVSCHRINGGEYATGVFGYMCDNNTLIAYRTNASEHNYSFYGFQFKGNSKAWRSNVLFDLSTSSFAIGRQYPSESDELVTEVKEMLKNTINEKFPAVKFGYIRDNFNNVIEDKNSLHYNDFLRSGMTKYLFTPKDGTVAPSFMVGSPVLCVYCGKTVNSAGYLSSHSGCL